MEIIQARTYIRDILYNSIYVPLYINAYEYHVSVCTLIQRKKNGWSLTPGIGAGAIIEKIIKYKLIIFYVSVAINSFRYIVHKDSI